MVKRTTYTIPNFNRVKLSVISIVYNSKTSSNFDKRLGGTIFLHYKLSIKQKKIIFFCLKKNAILFRITFFSSKQFLCKRTVCRPFFLFCQMQKLNYIKSKRKRFFIDAGRYAKLYMEINLFHSLHCLVVEIKFTIALFHSR